MRYQHKSPGPGHNSDPAVGDTYHNTNRAVLVAAPEITSGRSVPASSWQIVGDDCGQHAAAA